MQIFISTILSFVVTIVHCSESFGKNALILPHDSLAISDSVLKSNTLLIGGMGISEYTDYDLLDIIFGIKLAADYTPNFEKDIKQQSNLIFRPSVGIALHSALNYDNYNTTRIFLDLEFILKYRITSYYILAGLSYYYCGKSVIRASAFRSRYYETRKLLQALNLNIGIGFDGGNWIYEIHYYHSFNPPLRNKFEYPPKDYETEYPFHFTFNVGRRINL